MEDTVWYLEDARELVKSVVAYPRPKQQQDRTGFFVSSYGGYGRYLKRSLAHSVPQGQPFGREQVDQVIRFLFLALKRYGIVEQVRSGDVPGYQINADALRWLPADGEIRPVDRTRLLEVGEIPPDVNRYFVECYRSFVDLKCVLEAREHTAQVTSEDREVREDRFRSGDLPLLFCSPTMELGVDIAQLNLVNLRNVPPTPANYAQRSGRAGRGGQGKVLRPVDYKNLGSEEFGGVYESFLALTPQISSDGARFTFAEFAGNERKTSGSYYTPDSLVQCLLDSALDPVVNERLADAERLAKSDWPAVEKEIHSDAAKRTHVLAFLTKHAGASKTATAEERKRAWDSVPPAPRRWKLSEEAILAIKVCDKACGSGHFLVGAGRARARSTTARSPATRLTTVAARAEDEERPGKRVARQGLSAQCRQAINALAKIHRLDRHQDPHVRGDLDHER